MTQISKTIYTPEAPASQTIGKRTITLNPNANHATLATSINQFLKTDEGLFRFGQLIERGPKFANAFRDHFGMPTLPFLDDCAKKSFGSWTWLTTIPHAISMTPGTIAEVQKAAESWGDSSLAPQQKRHKIEKAVLEVTDTAAMYSYSVANVASLFPSMSKVFVTSLSTGASLAAVKDGISLHMNVGNMARAVSVDTTKASQEIQETLKSTIRANMLGTLKDVTALASYIFGTLLLAAGTTVLPVVALAALSFSSTVFAVLRKLYEDSMSFKPINFLDNRHVSLITA